MQSALEVFSLTMANAMLTQKLVQERSQGAWLGHES